MTELEVLPYADLQMHVCPKCGRHRFSPAWEVLKQASSTEEYLWWSCNYCSFGIATRTLDSQETDAETSDDSEWKKVAVQYGIFSAHDLDLWIARIDADALNLASRRMKADKREGLS